MSLFSTKQKTLIATITLKTGALFLKDEFVWGV